jgi:hypothetical protein
MNCSFCANAQSAPKPSAAIAAAVVVNNVLTSFMFSSLSHLFRIF